MTQGGSGSKIETPVESPDCHRICQGCYRMITGRGSLIVHTCGLTPARGFWSCFGRRFVYRNRQDLRAPSRIGGISACTTRGNPAHLRR